MLSDNLETISKFEGVSFLGGHYDSVVNIFLGQVERGKVCTRLDWQLTKNSSYFPLRLLLIVVVPSRENMTKELSFWVGGLWSSDSNQNTVKL